MTGSNITVVNERPNGVLNTKRLGFRQKSVGKCAISAHSRPQEAPFSEKSTVYHCNTKLNAVRAWEAATGDSPPINLEARFQNGDACFFAYAYLGYCHFDRSGVIELHFASRILRLEDRNLSALYAALARHTVSVIQEAEASDGRAEGDTSIEEIEVTDEED